MRPTHDRRWGEAEQGVVCLASAPWWPVGVGRAIAGLSGAEVHARQRCRPRVRAGAMD
jgi:hypothetical protein